MPSFIRSSSLRNFGCVAHPSYHQAVLGRAPPSPLASRDHSTDAHLRPWRSAVEAEASHAPQTAWNEGRVALTQPDRSQVPSGTTDPDVFGKSWSQCGDGGQAVEAPAQPASLRHADHLPYPMPAWSYMPAFPDDSARSTGQAHITGLGNVSSWMVPVLGHVPSLYNHRRRHRKPHARPDPVICEKCEKSMRPESLRRHIREVHEHIKRSYTKSSFATGP
ncbi:hypothetical protein J3R83DRAFT_1160 [Lanmaoa asiatica]|nr:hypothetical protein J3R83DRAFT_1160 [Lanmaoa asiatica]